MKDMEIPPKKTNRRSTSSALQSSLLLGGKYAGYLVEFSVNENGVSLVPVPERYIPDELIRWGQVPKSWEVLISEKIENKANSETLFRRETITVLPGVGCGLDSLETNRTVDSYLLDTNSTKENGGKGHPKLSTWYHGQNKVAAIDTLRQSFQDMEKSARNIHLETIFDLSSTDHRLRVSIEVEILATRATRTSNSNNEYRYKVSPSVPIRTYWERRYYNTDSIDANDHLDAGTVFDLIGENLRGKKSELTTLPKQQVDDKRKTRKTWTLLPQLTIITGPSENEEDDRWCLDIQLNEIIGRPPSQSNNIQRIRREFQGFDCTIPDYK